LPYKVNEKRRRNISKARYRVQNWRADDTALRRRGDLTVWVTPTAMAAGTPTDGRNAGLDYASARPGPSGSRSHHPLSRRRADLTVVKMMSTAIRPVKVMIGATGLTVFGADE
jgi:hypothetical protein